MFNKITKLYLSIYFITIMYFYGKEVGAGFIPARNKKMPGRLIDSIVLVLG